MTSKILIIPYFGKFPNYFQFFLDSCSNNSDFNFIIFTDQKMDKFHISSNIKVVGMSFVELNNLVKDKLKINYPIYSPYKLCDFKPTYGVIFEDYIKGFDFWGYCDVDLVFGKIGNFLTEDLFKKYDKLLTDGHLTFYKNTKKINFLYKNLYEDIINFDEVVKLKEPCFFDEIFMPVICKRNNVNTYVNKTIYADILPQFFDYTMPQNNIKNQTFSYDCKKLIRNEDNKEFMYIHLQKRKMSIDCDRKNNIKKVYIYPNVFSSCKNHENNYKDVLYTIKYYINFIKKISFQKIKIKLRVLKYKNKE